jgi:hypothetical protein
VARHVAAVVVALSASPGLGCSASQASESTAPPTVLVSAAPSSASPISAPPPKPELPRRETFPTLQTAGAEACRIGAPVRLGARHDGDTIVGFGSSGGVAVMKRDATTLLVQPIGFDALKTGKATTVSVPTGVEPIHLFSLEQGFVVLLRLWDWQGGRASWSAVMLERSGRAHPPVDIGLDGMDVRVAQPLDGQRVGLVVAAAAIAKTKAPGRWQTLTVPANGPIQSSPVAVSVDDLVTTTNDVWQAAALDGKRGWLVLREGARRQEGVFDGVRQAAAAATPLRPSDAIVATMKNGAVPPPRGAGRMIREARGRPMLVRTHRGKEIGQRLVPRWRGTTVGVSAMYIQSSIFWSGSHFIYPFRHGNEASLLPIDCS